MARIDTQNPSSQTHTTTRIIQPRRLLLARWAWIAIIGISTIYGIITTIALFIVRSEPCAVDVVCSQHQLAPIVVDKYKEGGVPFVVVAFLRPILELITSTTYLLVGLQIFRRRSDDWMGLLASLMLCILGYRLTGAAGLLPSLYPDLKLLGLTLTSIMLLTSYATLYLTPNGQLYPKWAIMPFVLTIAYELLRGAALYMPSLNLDGVTLQVGAVILGGVGLYFQLKRYKILTPIERQQLKWVLLAVGLLLSGLLVSALALILAPMLDGSAYVVVTLTTLIGQYVLYMGLPLAFAFSMLRYRLWDADIVINRTLVYAGSTGTLLLVFFGLFFALKAILVSIIGTDSTLPLVISTATVAALFNPVRVRLARFVDKQIYGFRAELRDIRKRTSHETHFVPLKHAVTGQHSGKHLGGYRLDGVLGKGGMGEVYAAEALDSSGVAAVKILPPELATQTEPLARFQLEATLLSRLNHPNIVRTMGAGMTDGLHYLVMELIDGQTLNERFKQGLPIPHTEAVAILRDIAHALDSAHTAGIIHRDVKPSNILLRPSVEGVEAVLTDFGIAKLTQDATNSLTQSNLVGTLDYIAPEQIIASREIDHRADIYALGVIAYQMLVGQHPFGGAPAALLFAHLNQPAPDPRDSKPDFPRSLSQALLKALAKKPDERYASATDFAKALEV